MPANEISLKRDAGEKRQTSPSVGTFGYENNNSMKLAARRESRRERSRKQISSQSVKNVEQDKTRDQR